MVSLLARVQLWPRNRPVASLVVAVVAVELVGASGAIFTAQGLDPWYASLHKPALAPPNWVFGPVWTALFALMGTAVWLVWRRLGSSSTEHRRATRAIGVFVVHFAFNLLWSAAFFGGRSILLGLVVIIVLWLLIVVTILAFDRVDRRAALLLLPYLGWVSFAAFLNYRLWVLN